MKKQLFIVFSFIVFSLASCSDSKTNSATDNTTVKETSAPGDNKAQIENEEGKVDLEKLEEAMDDLPAE